jgi:hypothetical protein
VGDHRYAKDLLHALIPVNNSFTKPLRYATQASIDVSRDEELLELLADVNFFEVCIGIESPNKESLKEMGKYVNLKGDLVQDIHKILSYGLSVRGAFIGGFDHDDADVFDRHFEFIQKSFLPCVSLHMLNAPIGTRLWRRFREEGRVIDFIKVSDKVTQRIISNTIPKRMSRVELMQGFRDVYAKVFSWTSFKERMFGFISLANRPLKVRQETVSLEDLAKLETSLRLDQDACNAMNEIFGYAEQKAPYLLGRVKELVIQFVKYSKSALDLIPKLERQIELEASGRLTFELDNRPITIPPAFRDAYKMVFPEIHRRVYLNLSEKNRVPDALVEVFVEFLAHEENLNHLEEHHISLLNEIADRTCVRLSGKSPQEFVPVETSGIPVPNVRKLRLDEDVLKSVEQELINLAQGKAGTQGPLG